MDEKAFWETLYKALLLIAHAIKRRHLTPPGGGNGARAGVMPERTDHVPPFKFDE